MKLSEHPLRRFFDWDDKVAAEKLRALTERGDK